MKKTLNVSSNKIERLTSTIRSISAILSAVYAYDAVSAEPASTSATEVAPVSSSKNSDVTKDTSYGQGTGFLSDGVQSGFSSEDGVIKQTDFSRETGFSRDDGFVQSSGFSNLFLISSSIARDSNPSQVEKNKIPVWIYSATPQVLLNFNTELNRLYFNAALDVQRHSNEKVLIDREDPRLSVGWERKYASGSFGLNANFSQTSSRGQELRATGVFQSTNFVKTKAIIKSLSANWEYALAERWTLLTDGVYEENTFKNVEGLNDTSLVNLRSKLAYANSEKLNTYTQLSYAELRPKGNIDDSKITRAAVGADYQVSDRFNISSRANIYRLTGLQSDTGLEGGVKLEYNLERMNFNAELSRELANAAIGNFQKTDTLGLEWLFNMTTLDTFGATYIKSRVKQEDVSGKFEFNEIRAFYDRVLTGSWRGQASASFREQDNQGLNTNGNIIGISLTYGGLSF